MKWADSFKVWYKRDLIDTQSPPKKSPPPCYPRTFSIPLSTSCLIKITPLLTICLGFFYPQVLNVVPKNISPFLLSAFHLTVFFPMQAAIIGMWLIIAEGGRQAGMTVNQPSQGFVVPAVMSPSAPVSRHMSTFLPGASGWLIGAEPLAMSERI